MELEEELDFISGQAPVGPTSLFRLPLDPSCDAQDFSLSLYCKMLNHVIDDVATWPSD